MKLLYLLFFSLLSALGISQTVLHQPEVTPRTVQDPSFVVLGQGFKASSDVVSPFIAKIGPSNTTQPGGGPADSNAGINNPSGTVETPTDKFHDTQGNIDVTAGGQLQFTLPIALPPGVKSVAPQVNLIYTSGSGNGIAGYGWNLSGISAISRIARNIEKDGVIRGIQMDYTDYYSFNGQRLILKSGEYGKDGAEYVTEKYSNVKIRSVGSISGQIWKGPEYWEVTFEDGSQAWYGSVVGGTDAARTSMEYNIVKWTDVSGNYISYEYEKNINLASQTAFNGGVTVIKKISWGGNSFLNKPHFNEISFNYINREFKELSYHNGLYFSQDKILKDIITTSNQNIFKKYSVEYVNNGTSYSFVKSVTEYNSANEPSNPVILSYDQPPVGNEEKSHEYGPSNFNTKKYADFDLDGVTDYIEFLNNGSIVFRNSVYMGTNSVTLQYDPSRFTSADFKNSQPILFKKANYVGSNVGLVVPHLVDTSDSRVKHYEFQIYSIDILQSKLVFEYSKTLEYNQYKLADFVEQQYCGSQPTRLQNLVVYDNNGDGISELLLNFAASSYCTDPGVLDPIDPNVVNSEQISSQSGSELLLVSTIDNNNTEEGVYTPLSENMQLPPLSGTLTTYHRGSMFFDLEENVATNESYYAFDLVTGQVPQLREYNIADFNGDGKQDVYWINTSGKIMSVFNINKTPAGAYSKSFVGSQFDITLNAFYKYALFGDFNGDNKTDIIIPQADKSYSWDLYLSDGKRFGKFTYHHFIYFSAVQEELSENTHHSSFENGCKYGNIRSFQYNVNDLDGDGKSEIIVTNLFIKNHQWNAHHDQEYTKTSVAVYSVNQLGGSTNKSIVYNPQLGTLPHSNTPILSENNSENPTPIQTDAGIMFYRIRHWEKGFNQKVIPFGTLTLNRNNQQIILVGRPDDCNISDCDYNYVVHYDIPNFSALSRVKTVTQGGVVTHAFYNKLETTASSFFYKPVKKEQFPFFELYTLAQNYAVSKLIQSVGQGLPRVQEFRYRGFLSHLQGKGLVGFRKTARSSWYAAGFENTKIWSGTEIDPLSDGVPLKEWSIKTLNENHIFPADLSENNDQLLSLKLSNYQTDKLFNGQLVTTFTEQQKSEIVTAILPVSTWSKDFMTNTVVNASVIYGDYYLPVQTLQNVNNGLGISTSTFEYSHNPHGVTSDYFIGRLQSQTDVNQAYGDTKLSRQEYVYQNNLLKTSKTWNRDNSGFVMESYSYDGFGNVTQKTITNSVDSHIRTYGTVYDARGRFVIKKIDILGLETNISYNDWGQILSQTDPLGNTVTNTYDGWGKVLKSKTNLEGTRTYKYEKLAGSQGIRVIQYSPDGNETLVYTNPLGQNYKTTAKSIGQGIYVSKNIEFDALGRKKRESEPYFEGQTPNQWNEITYDDALFPPKVTVNSFTGKQNETTVSGLVTIVRELNGYNRTTVQTKDALGNIVSSQDKGGTVYFSYNAAGEQIQAMYEQNIVTTEYDAWGRKSKFNDPSNGEYRYEYNGFGQPKKIISPKGTKEYAYNTLGQLISQVELSAGNSSTNKALSFAYDDKGRVVSKSGLSSGKPFSSSIVFDDRGRLLSASESSNDRYYIQKGITYDDLGRIISYEKSMYSGGTLTKTVVENLYNLWNGDLQQVKDKNSGKILWSLKQVNARGQVLVADLGNTRVRNNYNDNGFLSDIFHSDRFTLEGSPATVLQVNYTFDAVKNELTNRTTSGTFNILESFVYDDNNRLVSWTNPVSGQLSSNSYDHKGRIVYNDQVGTIKFENSSKVYQPTGMTLNPAGEQNYTNDLIQHISYNENNDPVFINGLKGDVSFQYGLSNMRQRVSYGGNFNEDADGKFTKFYSEDGSFEVLLDNTTGKEKHVLYIGGSPYESNIVFLKNYDQNSGSYTFLHKDYLGSILAITDENGIKLEQRHFDAWGNFTHLQLGTGPIITDRDAITNASLILERGYTSHEHFIEVGIIHMNGRLYDPLLRRFLNADEHIQDPQNSQNYNKYGYVLNNPLLYNDTSGEVIVAAAFITAVIVGAVIGATSYLLISAFTGQKITLSGLLQSTFMGAVSGAVTFGIGSIFVSCAGTAFAATTNIAKSLGTVGSALAQGGLHAVAQGALSLVQGGNATMGAISGAFGSLGASAFGMVAKEFSKSAFGTVLSGVVLGGVGAELTGGNFWQGAVIGGIIAGLNHVAHSTANKLEENSKIKTALRKLNLDPKAKPDFSKEAVIDLTVRDENLNQMYRDADYPSIFLDSNFAKPGRTNSSGITLGQIAFQSYRDLYLTLGHEFIHAYHNASGITNYWVQKFGNKGAEYLTERGAYSWLQLYDVPSLNNRWENQFQREYGKYKHLVK